MMARRDPDSGPFEIHRRLSVYLLLVVACLAVAGGFGWLAHDRSEPVLWAPVAVFVLLAAVVLPGVIDARTPLFVADEHGVRMRDGSAWVGMLWSEMGEIRVERRDGRHDPRVKVIAPDGQRIHSAPLGFATTVSAGEAEVQLARRRTAARY